MPGFYELSLSLFMTVILGLSIALAVIFARMWRDDPIKPIVLFLLWIGVTGSLPFLLVGTGIGIAGQFPSFILTLLLMLGLGLSRFGERLILANGLAFIAAVQVFRLPLEYVLLLWHRDGFMPVQMTFLGDNLDIITGLMALPAAWVIVRSGKPLVAALVFNLIGFALLLRIIWIVALSSPTPLRNLLGGYETSPDVLIGLYFPTVWIASIGVAGAFLLHVASLAFVLRRMSSVRT
jgi:hypothetical protein